MRISLLLSALATMTALNINGAEPDTSGSWNQWRGPGRNGVVHEATWPDSLSEPSLSESWRVPLGASYSGPVVDEKCVYVTESVDDKFEAAVALDRMTGKEVWRTQWSGAMKVPFFAASNGSWIRSTPSLAGDDLYVAGMRDVIVCLNASNGQEKWRVDFPKELGTELPSFGFVASPLVDSGAVYVQAGAALTKLDASSGAIQWQALKDGGGMGGSAFSSPVIAELAGKRQIVVQTRTKLAGVDIDTGAVLWSTEVPAFRGMNILTPTVIGDAVFTSSYGGGSFLFDVRYEDGFKVSERWANKREAYMSSPIVVDKFIYLHMKNNRFTCINADSGEEMWATKPFGKYWSMIASGGRLLALDQRGDLMLINASPEKFDLVDKRKLGDAPSWAHVALSKGQLFVRELNSQVAYEWK